MENKKLVSLFFLLLVTIPVTTGHVILNKTAGENDTPRWELLAEDVIATVYNAVPSQSNDDCLHTASMYTIIPERIEEQRILAMERTMMKEYSIAYGDTVLVAGAGIYDGIWQVQDTMNKRFAGQHKIDFLVPKHIRHGKWDNIKVYKRI